MADMIDAKEAKAILGCDDETLNGHINSGVIRAQRAGGRLLVNKEDVTKLSGSDDDGTIVLTGDSENLQIDLGSVVDDTAATFVSERPASKSGTKTDQLTFGDELEVVSFEDNKHTQDLKFDDGRNTVDLGFTDQNTAVMSSVDQTAIGTTAPIEYNTGTANEATSTVSGRNDSSRRSVRSNRVRVEAPPVHWIWVLIMAFTTFVLGFFVVPFMFMTVWPQGDDKDYAGNQKRGVDDNFWTSMASSAAGHTVEPDVAQFKRMNGDAEFTDVKEVDPQAEWRYVKYRGEFKDTANHERTKTFVIEKISEDGKQAISVGGKKTYPLVEVKSGDMADEVVDLGFGK
jgi:hypothetical protein